MSSHICLGLPSARFLNFPQQNPVFTSPLLYSTSVTCSSGLIVLCLITHKTSGEQYRLWCLPLLSPLYSPVTSSIFLFWQQTVSCWTERYQAFPVCSLVLISSCMQFWFAGIARKCLSFALIVRGFISYLHVVILSCIPFTRHVKFLRRAVFSTASKPQPGGPHLVGCPRLLIQYVRSYPPYWRPFLHPQPEDAPCR